MYDYFYGQQAELFSFYRVPKVLFTDEKFSNISSDAKLLYGIMLDRMNLSAKNGWVDELGRVYIIFTIEEVKGALGCAEKKAVKLLHELENKCGLIERKRIGLGKPNYPMRTSCKAKAIPFPIKSYYVEGGFSHLIHMTAAHLW
mgnify:CR=1 FL=1